MAACQDKNHTVAQNISKLRESMGYSQRKFSSLLGVDVSSVGKWEASSTCPNSSHLGKIIELSGVSPAWLFTGQGPMFGLTESSEPGSPASPLPIYGTATAGASGGQANDNGSALYYLPRPIGVDDEDAFGVEIIGDSGEPRYKDGDVVVCVPYLKPETGKDVVVTLEWGETVLKRWQWLDPENVHLLSWNEMYKPMEIPRKNILGVAKVIGLVWGSLARKSRVDVDEVGEIQEVARE